MALQNESSNTNVGIVDVPEVTVELVYRLVGHELMESLGSRLNFHLHGPKAKRKFDANPGDHVGVFKDRAQFTITSYQELQFAYYRLYALMSKRIRPNASEEKEFLVYDSYLTIAENEYLEDLIERGACVVKDREMFRSLIRMQMRDYFRNGKHSSGRNEIAHPYSAAIEPYKVKGSYGYFFYELCDSLTARGRDPDVKRILLDGLDKLEELSKSDDLPEFLSNSKTCFLMQLRFLRNILILEPEKKSKPPEDADSDAKQFNGTRPQADGDWVTVVNKSRSVKTSP